LRRYGDFCDFKDGGCRHLGFLEIRYFNGQSAVGGQYASSCQISSKSVKRLQRYDDLTVFLWELNGTTHDDYLVYIVVQNLVEIDAVVSIT